MSFFNLFKKALPATILLLYVLHPRICFSQVSLTELGSFNTTINESSGLEIADSTSLWTINDSGGEPKLYRINHLATTIDEVAVTNATNIDWEDLAKDDSTGRVFIGDCGNNSNERKDLKIYIVKPDTLTGGNSSLVAQKINFSYPDQAAFPPSANNLNFDCEAQFYYNNNIYLISKNRSASGTGFAKLYRLPAEAGTYTAELLDSFQFNESITSADISPGKNYIIVMGYLNVWVFYNYSSPANLFKGSYHKKMFTGVTQRESIVIADSANVYLSDEKTGNTGGKLYSMSVSWLSTGHGNLHFPRSFFFAYPNPCGQQFFIASSGNTSAVLHITVLDISGRAVKQQPLDISQPVDISGLCNGQYYIEIAGENEKTVIPVVIAR